MKNVFKNVLTRRQQTRLYQPPQDIGSTDECNFYHTTDIPGAGIVEGQWDLRNGLDEYLGNYDFSGKRVLEIGPATGFLTFEIEKTAREIVAVELPMDRNFWNAVPYEQLGLGRGKNSGWTDVEKQFHEQLADKHPLTMYTIVSSRPAETG